MNSRRKYSYTKFVIFLLLFVVLGGSVSYGLSNSKKAQTTKTVSVGNASQTTTSTPPAKTTAVVSSSPAPVSATPTITTPAPKTTPCSSNTVTQKLVVSISQQHLWACSSSTQVFETAVVTGAYTIPGDATPTGSWKIVAKETNRHLVGPGYDDFVHYWMPFWGDYGLHDASWRSSFGGPDYPTVGSHGCVNLPVASATWIFNWATIGTTVTINS